MTSRRRRRQAARWRARICHPLAACGLCRLYATRAAALEAET